MDDRELREFFKKEYDAVKIPDELKQKILQGGNRKIYLLAAISASAFVAFILLMIMEISPQIDGIISALSLP